MSTHPGTAGRVMLWQRGRSTLGAVSVALVCACSGSSEPSDTVGPPAAIVPVAAPRRETRYEVVELDLPLRPEHVVQVLLDHITPGIGKVYTPRSITCTSFVEQLAGTQSDDPWSGRARPMPW